MREALLEEAQRVALAVVLVMAQAALPRIDPNYAAYLGVVLIGCAFGTVLQFMAMVKIHDRAMEEWSRQRFWATLASGPAASFLAAVMCIEYRRDPTLGTVLLWMSAAGLLGWQFLEFFAWAFKQRVGKA